MKRIRFLSVSILALVLCLIVVLNVSFSWFTLPRTHQGDSLEWNEISYDLSNKNGISIETFESSDDGLTFSDTPVTDLSNSTGLNGGARKYYRTDITNSSTYAQSVSLYLSSLSIPTTSTGSFYLGVNSPLRTYKSYGTGSNISQTQKNNSLMRVYFQPKGIWTEDTFDVYVNGVWHANMNYLDDKSGDKTYYADIPSSASTIYFHVPYGDDDDQRTREYTISEVGLSQTQSYVFYLYTGLYENKYINSSYDPVTGSCFISYYDTINLGINDTFSACLTNGTNYIGGSIEYYSSNTDVFTVDKSTGLITPVSVGTAKLYSKIVNSSYNDDLQVETIVNVENKPYTETDIPIVTNMIVSPKNSEGNTVSSVYWYIRNDAESGTLTYTIKDLYASL